MADVAEIRTRALSSLAPPPRIGLADWIEARIRLPSAVSATPGPVKLWAFQRGIADAMGDPTLERVSVVKPVRAGLSMLMASTVGYYASAEPCPIGYLLPSEADCRDFAVSDLDPTFENSPALAGLLAPDADRSTLTSRRFPGGSVKILPARSPRGLRRHNLKVLLCDEVDGMPPTPEGDPIQLAERRTLSFASRRLIAGSTPTFADTSKILKLYAQSDMRVFETPCPNCGAFFEITWSCIHWPEGRPEEAACECPHCKGVIHERHKVAMVEAGAWRATRPEVRGHAGFKLSALISPLANASWARIASEFLEVRNDPERLQVWTNTLLAEPWSQGGEEVQETELAARAEPISMSRLPAEVLLLVAGCDVQRDRVEIVIVGFSRDGAAWVLGHEVVYGDPNDGGTWGDVDAVLRTRWKHPLGGSIGLAAAGIDAGDGATMDAVLSFCAPRAGRRVLAVKGVAGQRPALVPSKAKTRGGRLWICGVDGLKTVLFNRLQAGTSIRFSDELDAEFFAQVTSERRIVRYSRGQPVARFERIPGKRAEALDCLVYALAVRSVVQGRWDERQGEVSMPEAPQMAAPRVSRSRWMER